MTLQKILAPILIAALIAIPVAFTMQEDSPFAARYIGQPLSASVLGTSYSSNKTGIIIPLYTYPTSPTWQEVGHAKGENPSVPVVVVINPHDGPGSEVDQNYILGIGRLRASGVIVLGYVFTSYAKRSLSSVEYDISRYHKWYNVSGIFFDEMSNVQGHENYYSSLNAYAKSLGYVMTVGNPGSNLPEGYIGTLDVFCIYEGNGPAPLPELATWVAGNGKGNFASLSYGVQSLDKSFETAASRYVGWEYITSYGLPNPYNALPSYLSQEVAALNSESNVSQVRKFNLLVQSLNASGAQIYGPQAAIEVSNGTLVATGNTPLNYIATAGETYTVMITNSSSFKFEQWSDGSKLLSMNVNLNQSTTVSAYFEVEISPNASNSTSTTNSIVSTTSSSISATSSSSEPFSISTSTSSQSESSSPLSIGTATADFQIAGVILLIGWMLLFTMRKMK